MALATSQGTRSMASPTGRDRASATAPRAAVPSFHAGEARCHRSQAPLPHGHRRHRGHHQPRDAARGRHGRRRLGQGADRHRELVERDHPVQPLARPPRAGGEGGRARRRRLPAAVRHRQRQRRHLDGPRGHALLAGEPRGHRRLGRGRHAGRAPRRLRAARRLRQVDPRHADGRRAARPGIRLPLRRLDRARLGAAQRRHREGHHDHRLVRGGRRRQGRHHERGGRAPHRVRLRAGRGCLRRHVHREHDGERRRGARAEPAGLRQPRRRRPPPRLLRAPLGRGRRQPAQQGHHRPPDPDQGGVRERHRRRHGARRLDQHRAAPARDRARGRGRADPRRLQPHRQRRCRTSAT